MRARARRPRRASGRRPGRRLRPDGPRLRALRRRLQDRPAHPGGRARRPRPPTSAPSARSRSSHGKLTHVDTWAGRGGLGSKMLQQHGIAAVIYGGTFVDEDFRDRKVADEWFEDKYQKKLGAKDLEATVKYRFDPEVRDRRHLRRQLRHRRRPRARLQLPHHLHGRGRAARDLHQKFIVDHYLKQFNEETISTKQQHTCGEPCAAVCKKMHDEFKKDYEPYQTMGPLCGIFDQRGRRAAQPPRRHATASTPSRWAASSPGSWSASTRGSLSPEDLGVTRQPVFSPRGFAVETDSHAQRRAGRRAPRRDHRQARASSTWRRAPGKLAPAPGPREGQGGPRPLRLHRLRPQGLDGAQPVLDARAPSRPWPSWASTTCTTAPSSCRPRTLGRINAERFRDELIMDNLGICRFHRVWAEEMLPEIVGSLYGMKEQFLNGLADHRQPDQQPQLLGLLGVRSGTPTSSTPS